MCQSKFLWLIMILDTESESVIQTAVDLIVNYQLGKANPLERCLDNDNNLMFVIQKLRSSGNPLLTDLILRDFIEPLVRLAWIDFGACKDLFDFPSLEWFRFLERRLRI